MLAKAVQYLIPYNDLVDTFYIALCNRFLNPSNPAISIMGYSEIENVIKECFNGVLYEIAGNPSYSANLDETLFPMMRERLKHAMMMNGIIASPKQVQWWDYFIEEVIYPKIMERVVPLRNLGQARYRMDWLFDTGCIMVKI